MNELLKPLMERWNKLSGTKKSIFVVMAIAILLAAVFFVQWLTKVEYAPLMTNLDPKNASAVVEKLKELGIDYKLENQGTTIGVPKDKVYETMIQLAGAGILNDTGVGFEIFDQQKLGATDFDNNINLLRAMQEELRRTIVAFEEIERARVHLVLPKDSLFIEEEQPASAAITIELKPLAKLKPEQVKGIIDLVSSSVPNLPPENVKIIDSSGKVLSDEINIGEEASFIQQTQYEMRRAFEKDLEKRVQTLLATIFGEGKAVVMISADLDFDKVEEETVEYGEGSIVGQEAETEQSTGGGMGGVVGDPNLTPQVPGYNMGGQTGSTHQRDSSTTNYLVDQIKKVTVKAPGQIRSLSTSVVVNGQFDQEQLTQMEQLVVAAIGYQQLRGDQISVTGMAFESGEDIFEPEPVEQPAAPYPSYFKWMAIGAGVLILFMILANLRRRKKKGDLLDSTIGEVIPVIPIEEITPKITPEEKVKKQKQQRIKDIARQKPDEAAQLIKTWLAED